MCLVIQGLLNNQWQQYNHNKLMQMHKTGIANLSVPLGQFLRKGNKQSLQKIFEIWHYVEDKQKTRSQLWSEFMKWRAEKKIDFRTQNYLYRYFRYILGLNVRNKMAPRKEKQLSVRVLIQKLQKDDLKGPIWIKNKSINEYQYQLGPFFVEQQYTLQSMNKITSIVCSLSNAEAGGNILVVKQCQNKAITKGFSFNQPPKQNVNKIMRQVFQKLSTRGQFIGSERKTTMKDLVWYEISQVPIYENSSFDQAKQYGILIKIIISMKEFNERRGLFYMNISKGQTQVPKFYKVEKDMRRAGGYSENEVDNTMLYNCMMRNNNKNKNKGYPISMRKEIKEIEYKSSPSSKIQLVEIIKHLKQYNLRQQFPFIQLQTVILQFQVDYDKRETIMNQVQEMINKEVPRVEYYKLTLLEEYQKNKADKNKTIEGENWSRYIFFIVFRGNHKLPIYQTIRKSFINGSVSAVDNNINIQKQDIKYFELKQMRQLVESIFNKKLQIIDKFSKKQITENSQLSHITIKLQKNQKNIATFLCTILSFANKRKSCRFTNQG